MIMVRDETLEISDEIQRKITSEHLNANESGLEVWCIPYALLLSIVVVLIVLLFVCQSYKKSQKKRRMARKPHFTQEYMSGDSDESLKMEERGKSGRQIVKDDCERRSSLYDGKHNMVTEAVYIPEVSRQLHRDHSQASYLHMRIDIDNPTPVPNNDPWTPQRTLGSPDMEASEFWEKMTSSDL